MPKNINWVEIKKRYLQGDKPQAISADHDVTSKQIRDKASREKWSQQKATLHDKIAAKIEKSVEKDLTKLSDRLMAEYERLAFSDMKKLARWNCYQVDFKDSESLTADETTCVSSISRTVSKNGNTIKLKLHDKLGAMDSLAEIVGLLKKKKGDENEDQERPGINIIMPGAKKPDDDV